MKHIYCIGFLLTLFFLSFSYSNEDRIYYQYDVCKGCLLEFSKDTVKTFINDKDVIELVYIGNLGSCYFVIKKFGPGKELKGTVKGFYKGVSNKRDTICKAVVYGGGGIMEFKCSYYKPLRDSIWLYYDSKEHLYKTEFYVNNRIVKEE